MKMAPYLLIDRGASDPAIKMTPENKEVPYRLELAIAAWWHP
jgi:hypothetical protein